MNKARNILIILPILALGPFALAQDSRVLEFADYKIEYDSISEIEAGGENYYASSTLVASTFDTDGSGRTDLWLKYGDQGFLEVEAIDADADGVPEIISLLDQDGEVTKQTKPEYELEEVVLPENPNPDIGQAEKPGGAAPASRQFTLNPPPENGGGLPGSAWQWLLAALIVGGIFWFVKKKKK